MPDEKPWEKYDMTEKEWIGFCIDDARYIEESIELNRRQKERGVAEAPNGQKEES